MWNLDNGMNQIDKYLYYQDDFIKAGGYLAIGVVSCGVRDENDPAFALLCDHMDNPSHCIKSGAICGLGIAYAGCMREDVKELLLPIAANTDRANMAEVSQAALFLASCSRAAATMRLQGRSSSGLLSPVTRARHEPALPGHAGRGPAAGAVLRARGAGGGDRGAGWPPEEDHRLPDPHHASC